MSKTLKYILIGLAIVFGLFTIGAIVLNIMIASAFGAFDKNYSVSELKEEYYSNEKEIDELILYFNKIKPKDKIVSIEFKDDEIIGRLAIENKGTEKKNFQSWNFNKEILLTPDLKNMLNWDLETIEILKEKLDNADCISIEDGEPIKIGFKRSGLGMYSFDVFQDKATNRNNFNNNCNYILVNNKLALEYGGGAVGPQCFQNFK
ncbi:hypothetical protein [Epilithonimonas sp. UC225_85]|uniref:hypothetical protein n=1 Tax=Epilithonimonas sp. UC225_85 TaxID=3350167 RepID=UPI0036D23110